MSAPRHARFAPPRAHNPLGARVSTPVRVAGAVAEVMGNADLVRCVLGHVLAGIKAYNARALAAAASGGWTRVSRAHWDACRSANSTWAALTRRHFGTAAPTLVPSDARANFFALCRKAQSDHMGLPIFLRFGVEDVQSLGEALLENEPGLNYDRGMSDADWRVRGLRIRYRSCARYVLRLLSWHPHGKYAHYDVEGMVAYFLDERDIPRGNLFGGNADDADPESVAEALRHRMGAFLYPNDVTDWHSLLSDTARFRSARGYVKCVRKMQALLARFRQECA